MGPLRTLTRTVPSAPSSGEPVGMHGLFRFFKSILQYKSALFIGEFSTDEVHSESREYDGSIKLLAMTHSHVTYTTYRVQLRADYIIFGWEELLRSRAANFIFEKYNQLF